MLLDIFGGNKKKEIKENMKKENEEIKVEHLIPAHIIIDKNNDSENSTQKSPSSSP